MEPLPDSGVCAPRLPAATLSGGGVGNILGHRGRRRSATLISRTCPSGRRSNSISGRIDSKILSFRKDGLKVGTLEETRPATWLRECLLETLVSFVASLDLVFFPRKFRSLGGLPAS